MPRPRSASRVPSPVGGVLACALLLAPACDEPTRSSESPAAMRERVSDLLPAPRAADAPLPADRAEILQALAPLPTDALLVVYEVQGPGGLTGTLEVLARPGGYRRENWTISVPRGSEEPRRIDGSTIQTPDGVWSEGHPPDAIDPSPLGALADAYLSFDDDERRAVVERLGGLRRSLVQARNEAPTDDDDEILGVTCHTTRVAAIELCLWEATGLPLRYVSDGLQLQAINVDLHASIGAHAFELPAAPPPAPHDLDAVAALRRFAEGDLAVLAPWLHPGLRLPSHA